MKSNINIHHYAEKNLTINGIPFQKGSLINCEPYYSTLLSYNLTTNECEIFCCAGSDVNNQPTLQTTQMLRPISVMDLIYIDHESIIRSLRSEEIEDKRIGSIFREGEYTECQCDLYAHSMRPYYKQSGACSSNGVEGTLWRYTLRDYDRADFEEFEIAHCLENTTNYLLYVNMFIHDTSPYGDQFILINLVVNSFEPTYNPEFFEVPPFCDCSP